MRRHHETRLRATRQRGSMILLVLVISSVLLAAGLALNFSVTHELRTSSFDRDRKSARYVAEQGLKAAEEALFLSYAVDAWNDDLDPTGSLGRPVHPTPGADQPPLNLHDQALNRNGLVVYEWDPTPPASVTGSLWQVPVTVRDGNARYTVWVRNNPDDFSGTVTEDDDGVLKIVSLGEILDGAGNVRARTFLTELLRIPRLDPGNYGQKGLGAGGTSTIEP